MSGDTDYIDITPARLAVLCVERAAIEVKFALNGNPIRWWFAITDTDQALASALVEVLTGTAGIGALTDQLQNQWLDYFENSRNDDSITPPDEMRLVSFPSLLERAQDPANCYAMGGTLSLAPADKADVLRLHDFRNDLVHVKPKSWSLQISGLPRIIGAAAAALHQLFNMHPLCIHLEEDEVQKANEAIKQVLKDTGRNLVKSSTR